MRISCTWPRIVWCLLALVVPGCSKGADSGTPAASAKSAPQRQLQPVSLPDLTQAEAGVRAQARELHAALTKQMQDGGNDRELAGAYGNLAMFLHAAEYLGAALPYYTNAEALAPDDVRWPYGRALLLQTQGHADEAIAAFRRALTLQPDDMPASIWLARLYLDQGNPAAAATLLTKARTLSPHSVPVLAGLGQAALAERRHDEAVRYFEEALRIDPGALSLHAPLANAYRALGRTELAEAHRKQWRNRDVLVSDPHREQIDLMLRSGLSYELRGLKAMQARDWRTAAARFREGLSVAPPASAGSRSLHHKLGTVLYMSGDPWGAVGEFREVLRTAPGAGFDEPAARAHYSLGVLMASGGRSAEAIEHLLAAVRYRADYGEAHLALADALRGTGRFDDAITHYLEAMRIVPSAAEARFGYALALVRLDRFVQARDGLVEGLALQPGQPMLTQALARILAASPDQRARDGRRAVDLAQQLAQQAQTIDVGETLAMAFAEVGDYGAALEVQKEVMAAATRGGLKETADWLGLNLRRYERHMPCRAPWAATDPVNRPAPPVTRELAAVANAIAARR